MEFNFKNAMVKSGSKSVDESYAQLQLTSTFNVFKLNQTALRMMGIAEGDKVIMFDMGESAQDENSRFFITAGYTNEDGVEQGAKITGGRSFSYNVIYGAILMNDGKTTSIHPDSMIDKGLLYPKSEGKNSQYVAKKTASAKLVPFMDGEAVQIADGVSQPVYALTDIRFEEHTKRELGTNEELDFDSVE